MLRVLLASADETLINSVKYQLDDRCQLETCGGGEPALELIRVFDPDVMMIDTHLSGTDAFTVIRTARLTGKQLGIVVVTALQDDCTIKRLAAMDVNYIFLKPCKPTVVVSQLMDIGWYMRSTAPESWCVDDGANGILLDLGFRMGPKNYTAVRQAILARFHADNGALMKDIYYEVGKVCGGTSQQKEKAIRDSIKSAMKRGDPRVWNLYFEPNRDGTCRCPTNEEFVARIAACLLRKTRLKLPYENTKEKAM